MSEKIVIIAFAPLLLVMIVLGWFYLSSKGKSRASIILKGLGIEISLSTVTRKEEVTNEEISVETQDHRG